MLGFNQVKDRVIPATLNVSCTWPVVAEAVRFMSAIKVEPITLASLMGMNPAIAFPIMINSCAYLMPVDSIKFIKEGAYAKKACIAIAICGLIGVFIAFYIVKSLPLAKTIG